MDRTNADQFRANMKEWMESAQKEPIKITRKSGESFVLVKSETFEKMQIDLARLEGLTVSLVDLAQGRTSRSTTKSTAEVFEKAKKRALSAKKSKKVAG